MEAILNFGSNVSLIVNSSSVGASQPVTPIARSSPSVLACDDFDPLRVEAVDKQIRKSPQHIAARPMKVLGPAGRMKSDLLDGVIEFAEEAQGSGRASLGIPEPRRACLRQPRPGAVQPVAPPSSSPAM